MKLTGKFEFIGIQEIQGKKDTKKVYYNVALMQGIDVVKVFLNDDQIKLFANVKRMDQMECDLTVNLGSERTYVGVDAVRIMK